MELSRVSNESLEPRHRMNASIYSISGMFDDFSKSSIAGITSE